MSSLSQIFKNGQALQAKAGAVAIAQNDVLAYGGIPVGLYPIKTTDYAAVTSAGSQVVALTTYTSNGGASNSTKNRVLVDPVNGDVFIIDSYLTGTAGLTIWRYSYSGAFLGSFVVDSGAASMVPQMAFLPNGTIAIAWSSTSLYFMIIDKAFNVVVAPTAIAVVGVNPGPNFHMTALSGGGFAICWAKSGTGSYIAIYSNTGVVVKAPTLIAGLGTANSGNTSGPNFRLAQLSNGNIAVAVCDSSSAAALQFLIYDTSGTAVVAVSALTSGTAAAGGLVPPEIAVINGYFCIASRSGKCYVVSNAGVVQGAAVTVNGTAVVLLTDGVYFYLLCSSGTLSFVRLSSTGAVVTTSLTGGLRDAFIDAGGAFVLLDGTNANIFTVSPAGVPAAVGSVAFAIDASVGVAVGNLGDFCALGLQAGKFHITKYMSASILGIAQTAVAAGNAGTLVTINEGPGGYIANEIKGSVGKIYDHSAAAVPGNKGVLFVNSITMKGI